MKLTKGFSMLIKQVFAGAGCVLIARKTCGTMGASLELLTIGFCVEA
ncbi:MAG: hypothetical protein WAV82_12870 [Methylobacter sp.]